MQNLIKTLKKYDVFVYILAILLLLLIASFSFSHTGVTNSPETTLAAPSNSDNWQDNASYRDTSWSGSGTSGSPYLITSAQELAGLAYMVNNGNTYSGRYFRQTRDIDLSAHYWTPIGNDSNDFAGNYDGNYNEISGLYFGTGSYHGLFGAVVGSDSLNASVSNLTISNSSIIGSQCTGSFVGYTSFSILSNLYNTSTVGPSSGFYVGGIVGRAENANIYNCHNTRSVRGNSNNANWFGGIVGFCINSSIKNCFNTGQVSYGTYIGGIAGGTNSSTIINCYNSGLISNSGYGGGIVGSSNNSSKVLGCYNEGLISSNDGYNGGIVGRNTSSTISDCFNTGEITRTTTGGRYKGGIVGYNQDNSIVNNCFNLGFVDGGMISGGIAGGLYSSSMIYNCFNIAIVKDNNTTSSGKKYNGGIVGSIASTSSVSNSFFGGECLLTYGIAGNYSTSSIPASNQGCTKISNLNSSTYAKNRSWYTRLSNWNTSYPWDFDNTWDINSSINDGYPYLKAFYNYNISYNYNGGSAGSLAPSSATIDQVIQISTPNAPANHVFAGWTASGLDASTAQYGSSSSSLNSWTNGSTSAMGEYFLNLASPGSTVTLTAHWEEIQYNVQINYNDGATSNRTISNIPYLTVFNVPNPTRTAYNFAGWSSSNKDDTALVGDSATSCTTSWTSGTTKATFFSKLTSTDGRTVILTANWDPINYTIDFNLNGGTLSNPFSSYNTESTTTLPEPSKTGYTFTGWYCAASNGNWRVGTTYPAGTALAGMYGNVSFRATWEANTYTLTFDPQGGSVIPTSIQVTYGQTYGYHNGGVLPIPTRTDYVFGGWYVQPGNANSNKKTASSTYDIAGDSTIYAYWNETWNMYTEKPEGNGTTASPYLISEPEHLGWLSYEVARGRETTAVCRQTANISLEQSRGESSSEPAWYPIGTESYPFRGSYDGNGYSVGIGYYNFAFYADRDMFGLFGYTNGARINKVYVRIWWTFAQITQTLNFNNIGTVIGYAKGSTVISNSAIYYETTAPFFTGMRNSGVFIGYAESTVTITDCVVFRLYAEDPDVETVALSGGNPRIELYRDKLCDSRLPGSSSSSGTILASIWRRASHSCRD